MEKDNWVGQIRSLVRPFIAVAMTSTICYGTVLGYIEWKDLFSLAGMVIAFYFIERAALKIPGTPNGNGHANPNP